MTARGLRLAVAGGTGVVGRHVVDVARERGHDVVVLSRSNGVDVMTGEGLAAALEGADAVIDVLSIQTLDTDEAVRFFETTTTALLDAERHAGIEHHVALSIVGIGHATQGYYAGKVAQELTIEAGDVPWTILRATQFHEFAAQIHRRAKAGPIRVAPRMRTQPIAAREVAERLVELAEGQPIGRAQDLGGPREESLVDMIRAYAKATGSRGWIPAISLPGEGGRMQRDGSLLAGPDAMLGRQTFAEWLAELDGPVV